MPVHPSPKRAARRDKTPERKPIRRCLLVGNSKVRDRGGRGYSIQIAGIDRDLDSLSAVLGGAEISGFEGRLLYLPASGADIDFLEATCLDGDCLLSCMRACGSRHQVLLVDGCHAGAFFVNNRGIPDGSARSSVMRWCS